MKTIGKAVFDEGVEIGKGKVIILHYINICFSYLFIYLYWLYPSFVTRLL
jgi:hypothetical protein